MTGHTTCAASALNLLAGVFAMRDGVVSPTINLDHQDPECDLDCVPNEARELDVDVVLVNGFAFGGTNGALVARRHAGMTGGTAGRRSTASSASTGDDAEAIRNVPNTLAIFDSHFPRFPVLPGVLILGSLGRSRRAAAAPDGQAWRLAGAERVGFRHFVQPGDQLVFTVTLKELTDDRSHAGRRGRGRGQGRDPGAPAACGPRRGARRLTACAASPSPDRAVHAARPRHRVDVDGSARGPQRRRPDHRVRRDLAADPDRRRGPRTSNRATTSRTAARCGR